MRSRSESEIQRAILAHCNRLPGVVLWRANSGAVMATYKGKTRFVRFHGMLGLSDLIGWRSLGGIAQFLAIEVKRPGQPVTPWQKNFLELVRQGGGVAIVATSVEDVIAGLR